LTSGAIKGADGVHDRAHVDVARPSRSRSRTDERFDERPFRIGQSRRVSTMNALNKQVSPSSSDRTHPPPAP
jgi:hypothetical protein